MRFPCPLSPANRLMTLTLDNGRMITALIACAVGFVIAMFLLIAVFDFRSQSLPMSALRGGVIGGAAACGIFSIVFFIHVKNAGAPVVTINDGVIEIHRPEIGLIGWSQIERVGVEPVFGAKRFALYVHPPAPKPGFMTKLLFGLAAAKKGDNVRLIMPFGRFGISESKLQAALDAHRPTA